MDKIEIEYLTIEKYYEVLEVMKVAYPNWQGNYWKKETINNLIKKFPEGQIAIIVDGKVAGIALSIIVKYDDFGDDHTYSDITANYTFINHNPKGDTLYGIEVFIDPKYRGNRLGRRLYDARKILCEELNLKAIVFGGRLPNFHKHANELNPKQYIQKVKNKEIYDPVLSFQLSNEFHVKKVLKNYLPEDVQSAEYATLLQWDNVYYTGKKNLINKSRKSVRLGLVQWRMRVFNSVDDLYAQMEYFVNAVSAYKADFVLFPELFNAPLMHQFKDKNEAESMRLLSKYTPEIKNKFSELAVAYNVNIITGSMPDIENGELKNVGFVCHRSGKIDTYEKIHITPNETKYWGLNGGNILKTYVTDAGIIGVLICYDAEFPELSRLLADEGMQILFVPYLTDTQNAYMRVRLCAQARAVENECFVAITGSTGNLPEVENMDLNYSQSAVFTPSDFAFPSNAIKSEATANTEMVLVADVDLKLLDELNSYGSVRNLKDRRLDFYELKRKD